MRHPKPLASLSLDLDNQWTYMKIHGDAGWDTFPSYLETVVPRTLSLLDELGLKITYFIIGQDAALAKNHAALRAIAAAGHEIGNHSFDHDSWLHLHSDAAIEQDIAQAETVIEQATGQRPVGFRGPGYSLSESVLQILAQRGYQYDASTFPTFLGPLARAYYFMTAKGLTPTEKEQRKMLFGGFRDGFQPLKPYRWLATEQPLVEIPVTTMPIFKVPIHFSYILYLAGYSSAIALLYFRLALLLCKLTKTQPSLLLHPLDFLDESDAPELAFFPAMQLPSYKKRIVLRKALKMMGRQFEILPMGAHARALQQQRPQRQGMNPKFQTPIARLA
ncbi:MAG: polysaccharide deacetylase family protein [Leptolyngbya sp. SIO4C1]|nr:polysaccharide deacetylase family protein [Leptolyngbya sp. SIO4C1]